MYFLNGRTNGSSSVSSSQSGSSGSGSSSSSGSGSSSSGSGSAIGRRPQGEEKASLLLFGNEPVQELSTLAAHDVGKAGAISIYPDSPT